MKALKLLWVLVFVPFIGLTQNETETLTADEGYRFAYEYQVVTSIESVVPMGLGRSRIIANGEERDYKEATTQRTEEDDKQNDKSREKIRVKEFEETKLLNFYSVAGIRFQNIASNDALITSKINDMIYEGWELAFVTSAVESDAGRDDGNGIFITRYIFKRLVQIPVEEE